MAYALTRMLRTLVMAAVAAAVLLAIAIWSAPKADAHGWYDNECCNERDCDAVPNRAITERGDTIILRIRPGEHLVWGKDKTEDYVREFPRASLRRSQDERWHPCIHPLTFALLCIYEPPRSF